MANVIRQINQRIRAEKRESMRPYNAVVQLNYKNWYEVQDIRTVHDNSHPTDPNATMQRGWYEVDGEKFWAENPHWKHGNWTGGGKVNAVYRAVAHNSMQAYEVAEKDYTPEEAAWAERKLVDPWFEG